MQGLGRTCCFVDVLQMFSKKSQVVHSSHLAKKKTQVVQSSHLSKVISLQIAGKCFQVYRAQQKPRHVLESLVYSADQQSLNSYCKIKNKKNTWTSTSGYYIVIHGDLLPVEQPRPAYCTPNSLDCKGRFGLNSIFSGVRYLLVLLLPTYSNSIFLPQE